MKYFLILLTAALISCGQDTKPEKTVFVGQLIRSVIEVDGIRFGKMCTTTICTCTKSVGQNSATEMDCEFFDSIIRGELNHE